MLVSESNMSLLNRTRHLSVCKIYSGSVWVFSRNICFWVGLVLSFSVASNIFKTELNSSENAFIQIIDAISSAVFILKDLHLV